MKNLTPKFRLFRLDGAACCGFDLCVRSMQAPPTGAGAKITSSGVSKTESRQVSGFQACRFGITAKVEIRQGTSEGVTITGDDNIVALVETVVEDGKLKVRWNERNLSTSYKEL